MLTDAAKKAMAGDLRGAARKVGETAVHLVMHPPKPWHGKIERGPHQKGP